MIPKPIPELICSTKFRIQISSAGGWRSQSADATSYAFFCVLRSARLLTGTLQGPRALVMNNTSAIFTDPTPIPTNPVGLTVREVARRYRVGEDKVRGWIARGELAAVNTASALCGRPRWVVMPESLAVFEQRRKGGPPPKPKPRRRRPEIRDYYPD